MSDNVYLVMLLVIVDLTRSLVSLTPFSQAPVSQVSDLNVLVLVFTI